MQAPHNHIVVGPLPYISAFGMEIPTYPLVISLCFILALFWGQKRAKNFAIDDLIFYDFAIAVMLSGLLGARFFHILYEYPTYYLENPVKVFYFWQGGFVYFGGFMGAMIAGTFYLYRHKEPIRHWMDFIAPIAGMGYGFGRIACWLNGCCFGAYCELPWAFKYPTQYLNSGKLEVITRHPTQIYALVFALIVVGIVLKYESFRKNSKTYRAGEVFYLWLALHGLGRIFMEYFRADDRGSFILGFSISTWISITIIGVGIFMLTKIRRIKA